MKIAILTAVTVLVATVPAQAVVINAAYTGTVTSQANSTFAVGGAITGSFSYDTDLRDFSLFTIGGLARPAGAVPTVSNDGFTALYRSQLSAVSLGGMVNNTLALSLEGTFPTRDAVALLLQPNLFASLDATSSINYLRSNSAGTPANTVQVSATLTGLSVTAVPEPVSLALLTTGLVGLIVLRRSNGLSQHEVD